MGNYNNVLGILRKYAFVFLCWAWAGSVCANDFQIKTVVSGLEKPWSVAFLPDNHVLITEKPGRLTRVNLENPDETQVISGVPNVLYIGQGGLLEVLAGSDYKKSAMIYLSYSCGTNSANHTCVARGKLSGSSLTHVEEIFRSQKAKRGGAHFGGRMVWLADNTLLVTLGDGYRYLEEAQNNSNHLGTIVRINPDGSVPKDNPFVDSAGAKPEIYSYGHRNVQGIVYDEKTNTIYAHEHGPKGGDELNLIQAGSNYGWPLATYGIDYSGDIISKHKTYPGTVDPMTYWVPSIAPSGMALYQGNLFPEWKNNFLIGALAGRHVRLVKMKNGQVVGQEKLFGHLNERFRDVQAGPDGAVYLLTDSSSGSLLKVTPK